jgi:hypothetical protein
MNSATQKLAVQIVGKGVMAQVRELVKKCPDKETALPIYREMVRNILELERRHGLTRAGKA